jgi:dihydrodiol dehydrogenase / D-xylose 1-dehydrogenase (NADP)
MDGSFIQCRWALLGLSSIASTFVADLLLSQTASAKVSHKIVCVSSTKTKAKAAQWLKRAGLRDESRVEIFASYEDMLRAGNFDVVYVSTPHPLHYLQAKAALEILEMSSLRNLLQ